MLQNNGLAMGMKIVHTYVQIYTRERERNVSCFPTFQNAYTTAI